MTDKIVVLVTVRNMQEANTIAKRLVDSRLAACVNIGGRIRSIYRWKGKVVGDDEVLLFIKSKRNVFAEVSKTILENHSYTTPEIISLSVADGSKDYLEWIDASIKAPGGKDGKTAAKRALRLMRSQGAAAGKSKG